MKYKDLFIIMILLFPGYGNAVAFTPSESKITLKVIGEDGKPIEGADVGITFQLPKGKNNFHSAKGFSDSSGLFSGSSVSLDFAAYGAEKNGYYKSYGRFRFNQGIESHRWQPWNPTVELLLRKIEKPVPMYKRSTKEYDLELPVVGEEIGFDLVKYDWLPPHGHGSTADLIFKLEKRYTNVKDYDVQLTITFTNKYDGIQLHKEDREYGSLFKLPRFAPKEGYVEKLVLKWKRSPGKARINDSHEDDNYFFRVRSEVEDGKLVRAMYGKIEGPIDTTRYHKDGVALNFIYYLNPDYTRNMEFDGRRNLFK